VAERILKDRCSRNEATDLTDCLQFADKRRILVQTKELNCLFGESEETGTMFLKEVENLRNELAHSQDIVSGNWPTLVDLAEHIEKTLSNAEVMCVVQ
jgi:hypothetical protein